MKILITGANGFIGQHLICGLTSIESHLVIGTAIGISRFPYPQTSNFHFYSMDITKRIEVEKCIGLMKPDIVIHAAALSQPNHCELNKEECISVNLQGTENIIAACKAVNAYLLFLSTDFVFSGESGPYKEDDTVNPVNYYGWSKVKGEELCLKSGLQYSIARLCSVYGRSVNGQSRNVVMWVKQNLEDNTPVKVVYDQVRTPTYIDDVINGIITMAEQISLGIYHIAGEEILNPYTMALQTADYFGLDKSLIEKVSSATFVEPAKRPLVTGLLINKAKKDFNFAPLRFVDGLHKMFSV